MDMPMDHGDSGSMDGGMSDGHMSMVFFQSDTSPLFSSAWTPSDPGTYAGTCVFLIVLAILHRVLSAARNIYFCSPLQQLQPNAAMARIDKEAVAGGACPSDGMPDATDAVYRRQHLGQTQSFWAVLRQARRNCPFRTRTETARAVVEVVTSGIGYLLMLAIMTMNVGYFLSVLAGIFVGVFMVGRFGPADH